MTSPICLFCGYARSVPVAGCDHSERVFTSSEWAPHTSGMFPPSAYCSQAAHSGIGPHPKRPDCIGWNGEGGPRLPTASEEMASAFRAMEPLEVVPAQPLPTAGREDVTEALIAHMRERQAKGRATYGRSLETFNGRDAVRDLIEELLDGAQYAMQLRMERAQLEREVERLRAEAALLGPELVDLQHQVVTRDQAIRSLQAELEQERRESARQRADLESARQLLDEAERGGGR